MILRPSKRGIAPKLVQIIKILDLKDLIKAHLLMGPLCLTVLAIIDQYS